MKAQEAFVQIALSTLTSVLILMSAFSVYAEEYDAQADFQIRAQFQKEKIESYYSRLNMLDRLAEERQKGEDDMRLQRQRMQDQTVKNRNEYIKNKKVIARPDESSWLKEQKARAEQADQYRRQFVLQRDKLRGLMRGVDKIPEEEELGLDIYEDDVE